MSLPHPIERESEAMYFRMLHRVFFSEIVTSPHYMLAWDAVAVDHYDNFAGCISAENDEASAVVDEIERIYFGNKRNCTISVSPSARPPGLAAMLRARGYHPVYRDAWMYSEDTPNLPATPRVITIETVQDLAGMKRFVDVFNSAYSGKDPKEPYGAAPPEWGERLLASFGAFAADRTVQYYLLSDRGEASTVLLTSAIGEFGGIYSIGTAPHMRGRGHASLLTLHAVRKLREDGRGIIFLQTEKDSYNERFYTKLGFETEWVADAWSKERTS